MCCCCWLVCKLNKLQLEREQVVLLLAVLGSGAEDLMAEDRMAQAGFERVIDAFFHYANEPADGVYEFGYNRGNDAHHTARYEQNNGAQFRTKVQTKFILSKINSENDFNRMTFI